MATVTQIQHLTDELNQMAGVPIISGYDGNGYTRFDFKEPLEEHELCNIETRYNGRLIMTFDGRSIYLKK